MREELQKIANEIIELVCKKNADYGNSFFYTRESFGAKATVIRLWDKITRFEVLTRDKPQSDETIEDTLKDIVGYSLLELLYRRGK